MSPLVSLWSGWILFAIYPLVGAVAAGIISPLLLTWLGAGVGILFFIPYLIRTKIFRQFFDRRLVLPLLIMGFIGSILPTLLFLGALQYTTPANMAILAQIEVVYSIIIARILLKEKISLSQLGGTALVVFGTILILMKERYSPRLIGDLMVLAAPIMFQISHVVAKKLPKQLTPSFIGSARAFYAFFSAIPVVLLTLVFGGFFFKPGLKTVFVILIWGIGLNGLSLLLWYKAVRYMDLAKATAIILSYPVMTFILSAVLGFEKVHTYQFIGLICSMAGAYWVTVLVKKGKKSEKEIG
jgi:drug/metabolite transporter (DMT)-like permease